MKIRYQGYDVLAKWDSPSFDDTTRTVLSRRLKVIPERRFLTAGEWALLDAIVARLIPQPERAQPILITPWIDDRLACNRGEGFRHDNMPPLRVAWRSGLAAIDGEAMRLFGADFARVASDLQDRTLSAIQRGDIDATLWNGVPAQRFFSDILLKTVAGFYYAHPAAWSEIGFGGPASPRGYVRLGFDERDSWEAGETG